MEPDKDYDLTVGTRIREIREAYNLSRAAFSEKCDISDSFLAAVESGKKGVTSKTLYKVCTSMDVSADYLIRGHENGFEQDILIEMVSSVDRPYRAPLLRIIKEYVETIHSLSQPKEQTKQTEPTE